jgi:hypothetical protein
LAKKVVQPGQLGKSPDVVGSPTGSVRTSILHPPHQTPCTRRIKHLAPAAPDILRPSGQKAWHAVTAVADGVAGLPNVTVEPHCGEFGAMRLMVLFRSAGKSMNCPEEVGLITAVSGWVLSLHGRTVNPT